jgi:hypothetical protein
MKKFFRVLLLVSCVAGFSAAGAAEIALSNRYAGTVIDHFQLDGSGNFSPVILSEAELRGTFGTGRVIVLSQFLPDRSVTACKIGEIALNMVFARSVTTFADYSQLFVSYDTGWICVAPAPAGGAVYRGKVVGHFVGGTGRFVGATGPFESNFGGNDLSGPFVVPTEKEPAVPFPGFGSFVGSSVGTVILPKQ